MLVESEPHAAHLPLAPPISASISLIRAGMSSSSSDSPQLDSKVKMMFVDHFVRILRDRPQFVWRAWLVNTDYRDAFVQAQSSSLFLRLNSHSFDLTQGFGSVAPLRLQSNNLPILVHYLTLVSPHQNVEVDLDGPLMEPDVALTVGATLRDFLTNVPNDKFIRLSLPGVAAGISHDTLARLLVNFFAGFKNGATTDFSIDVICDSIGLEWLENVNIGGVKVRNYDENTNYSSVFSTLNASKISAPELPLDIFSNSVFTPNPRIKELGAKLTVGHSLDWFPDLNRKLNSAFPNLAEFHLEETFSSIENPSAHFVLLDEVAAECARLADLDTVYRILIKVKFYYNDVHECKNYEVLCNHGFGKRRKGQHNYMISTGTNVVELNMFNMHQ